jgi:hypothetical protein
VRLLAARDHRRFIEMLLAHFANAFSLASVN